MCNETCWGNGTVTVYVKQCALVGKTKTTVILSIFHKPRDTYTVAQQQWSDVRVISSRIYVVSLGEWFPTFRKVLGCLHLEGSNTDPLRLQQHNPSKYRKQLVPCPI
jgi:hypothetical protein